MNRKIFFPIIGIVIVLLVYTYYANISMDNRDRDNYINFNKSNLNNTITDLEEYARGVKLHSGSKAFVFYPKTSKANDNNIFIFTAKIGDKVIKKPFEDTLILKTNDNKIYKYTFFKFENK